MRYGMVNYHFFSTREKENIHVAFIVQIFYLIIIPSFCFYRLLLCRNYKMVYNNFKKFSFKLFEISQKKQLNVSFYINIFEKVLLNK